MVKCSQDSISQFNKNTAPYGAWNVILSEILDIKYSFWTNNTV